MGFKRMASALALLTSALPNWAMEDPKIRSRPICWVHLNSWKNETWNEDHVVNCGNTNLSEDIIIAVFTVIAVEQ